MNGFRYAPNSDRRAVRSATKRGVRTYRDRKSQNPFSNRNIATMPSALK